ncbi:helix-turn-helix domain-containing protein [Psychroflexus sediminis]|uniref:helix-turn-helix domain-containing protein n=1 Tax=Psychroflexus sediminis TaxID=470826 RepID=UPI0015A427C4|nr:helix-turn-helix transcriptional regulator [Psychroflexus sediminis]
MGQNIRKIRIQKGFSQEYMAETLGITQPTYARLEKDDHRISIVRLLQIAQQLETNVSELIGQKAKELNLKNDNTLQAKSNPYLDNKEYITTLKGEVAFLRELLQKFRG